MLVCGIYLVCSIIATVNLFLSSTVFRPMPMDKVAPRLQPPTPLTSLASPTPTGQHVRGRRSTAPAEPGTLPNPDSRRGDDAVADTQDGQAGAGASTAIKPRAQRRTRPPLWPLLLIPVIALLVAAMVALISATVIGFALAALYSAGGFSMAT